MSAEAAEGAAVEGDVGVFVLATANPDKAEEIGDVLRAALGDRVTLRPRPPELPEVDETGDTLEENALLKARAVAAATGEAAIADDTGLEVEALQGRPGVWSARYAGEDATYGDNVAKLLGELAGVPPPGRRARFRTVAAAVLADGQELVADGVVTGTIALEPAGAGGFGYDPVFVADGASGRTFAEVRPQDKHDISHRGRAFRALAEQLAVARGAAGGQCR